MNILSLEADVQAVIVRETLRSAVVDGGPLLVGTGVADIVGIDRAVERSAVGVRQRTIFQILLAAAEFVDVLDVIQVNTMRAVVFKGQESAGSETPFKG